MKKAMLILAVLATPFLYAQNNFPTNGQVTIGTATASAGTALDVNGRVVIDSSLTVKDSLVVEQRIRAKDKLIVDKKAVFKEDAVVRLNLKVDGNARVQSNLRVDGVARLDGNVRMVNIGNINNLNNVPFDFLVRKDNGQVKKASPLNVAQYLGAIGNIFGCAGDVNGNILNPMWQSAINKLFVDCPQVNVGIGTNNPQHKLTVAGTSFALTFLAGATNSPQNALYNGYEASSLKDLMHLGKEINGGAGNQTYEERFTVANSGAVVITNAGSDASLTINNGSNQAFVIYDSQNQKILQLEDNGLLRAREIRVDAAQWADYVFDEDYHLPKLSEVALYIDKNHKLPGMPSEKEVLEEGINVSKMQTMQMQKIEELTLYMIQMDEKMTKMEQKIEALEKENFELKSTKLEK